MASNSSQEPELELDTVPGITSAKCADGTVRIMGPGPGPGPGPKIGLMGPPKTTPKRRGSRGYANTKRRRVMSKSPTGGRAGDAGTSSSAVGSEDGIVNVNIDEEYQVETILDKRMGQSGKFLYYIKWIGWPEAANTWEPAENLDGCEEELKEFETRWAQGQKEKEGGASEGGNGGTEGNKSHVTGEPKLAKESSTSSAIPTVQPPMPISPDDDEEFMEYEILSKCPTDKIPKQLVGVVEISGKLTYLVEWEYEQENQSLATGGEGEEPDRRLINALPFKLMYPAMVIKYYEGHINFTNGPVPPVVL